MGRLGKLKSGSRGKVKQWKKGQSSSSNPQSKSHREKARAKFFQIQPTSRSNKGLTLEAVKMHDEMNDSQASPMSCMEDSTSEGGQTFATFLSGISDCDNVTFKKIKRYWENNSAKHKEVCAVLAAITEVIRQNNGLESDTAYFATLVTALGTVESTDSLAAVAYLLSLTCKRVPEAVLRSKFSEVSKLLVDTLMQSSKLDGSPTALIRSLLVCLATMLQKQDLQTWSNASTMNVYQTLLSFSVYSKPKIRKAAHNGICAVLKASSFMSQDEFQQNSIQHPAAVSTAKFYAQIIEKSGSISKESSSTTCHVISLMGEILHCFPPASLKRSCELILKLMTLSQPIIKSVCLQALYTMFKNQPKSSVLSTEMNAQMMTALYDYLPPANDSQPIQAWLAVMSEAAQNLTNVFKNSLEQQKSSVEQLALTHSTKLCKTCLKIMESVNRSSCQAAADTFKALLQSCICPIKESSNESSHLLKSTVIEIFKLLEEGLKFKFHSIWDLVFDLYAVAYNLLATPAIFTHLKGGLISMADLRNTPHFLHKMALDKALGSATETLGPNLILQGIPLMIDGTETDYDFPRSWLLPLLKDHVKNTELGYFVSYFLPLAAKLRMRALQLKANNQEAAANPYDTLQYQIWLLLPGFCDGATDLSTAFPTLARTIGTAITEREDLRMLAMQALRTILTKCTTEGDKQTIGRFAKNYLPILFNLYIDAPTTKNKMEVDSYGDVYKKKSPERLAALETLRLYLPFAGKELVCRFFTLAQQRVFDGAEENDATRLALLDLLIAMVIHVTAENLSSIYKNMLPMLKSSNHSMQKKAYRLLEEILESRSAQCREFVENKLEEIKFLLSDGLTSANPSAKGPRLKCMECVFKLLAVQETYSAKECFAYMQELIPEVIMCTREKKRARQAAFNLLVTAGNMYCEISVRNADEELKNKLRKESLTEYFQIVFAGLGGSPVTITSSVCALSRLVYEYKDIMSSKLLNDCISNVCILLGTNTREVCKACLGFVTVLLTILDRATLAQHVRQVLDALFEWKSQTRRHFRFRVKKMLERFVKKFDYETIYSMVPPEHHKQLANLRKTRERQKRKKLEKYESKPNKEEMEVKPSKPESIEELLEDSSDSDEQETTMKRKMKVGKKPISSTWLQDSQEEPIDLLDHSVSQRILSKNPNSKVKARSRREEFKSAADGRLIIGEDANTEDQDIENMFATLGIKKEKSATAATASKRKTDHEENSEDDEEESSYKPGGKGIHRIPGEIYKAKRAKGDVKRKGMPDPYAYVPLDRGLLNKRKQKKLTGQFHGLVKAAKHGAVKGKKLKQKNIRKGRSGKGSF